MVLVLVLLIAGLLPAAIHAQDTPEPDTASITAATPTTPSHLPSR